MGNDDVLGVSSGADFLHVRFSTFLPSSLPSALADGKGYSINKRALRYVLK
jgi:hypothetical protein